LIRKDQGVFRFGLAVRASYRKPLQWQQLDHRQSGSHADAVAPTVCTIVPRPQYSRAEWRTPRPHDEQPSPKVLTGMTLFAFASFVVVRR